MTKTISSFDPEVIREILQKKDNEIEQMRHESEQMWHEIEQMKHMMREIAQERRREKLEAAFCVQYSELKGEPSERFERKYQSLRRNGTWDELYRNLTRKLRDQSPTRK